MPGTAPISLMIAVRRDKPSICESSQMPAQLVLVRPSGVMASCSGNTSAKPPAAREPSSMMWKSLIMPSTDRYMVIGDMAMRLRRVTSFSVKGLNRSAMHYPQSRSAVIEHDRSRVAKLVQRGESLLAAMPALSRAAERQLDPRARPVTVDEHLPAA